MVSLCLTAHKYESVVEPNSRHQTFSHGGKTNIQSHFNGEQGLSQYEARSSKLSIVTIWSGPDAPISKPQLMENVGNLSKHRCQAT